MADDQINVKLGATDEGLQSGMDEAAAATEKATSSMGDAFKAMAAKVSEAMAEVGASVKEGIEQAHENMEGFASTLTKVQRGLQLVAEVMAVGFVGEKIIDMAKEFAEFGESIQFSAARAGASVQSMQELNYAAATVGLSAQTTELALTRLARAMTLAQQSTTGFNQTALAFQALGISAKDLESSSLDQVLEKIATAFASHADGASKAAAAQALFGRSGAELIPLLDKGAAGIDELRRHAEEMGVVLSKDDIEAASQLQEKLVDLHAETTTLGNRLAASLVPTFGTMADAMMKVTSQGGPLTAFFSALGDVLKAVVTVGLNVVQVFQMIAEVVATAASAAYLAAHGQFGAAFDAIKIGLDNIKKNAIATGAAMKALWQTSAPPKKEGEGEGEKKPEVPVIVPPDRQHQHDAQKLADAELALKVAQIKATEALDKQHLDTAKKMYDDAYANGLISTKQYYDAQLAITQEGLKGQIREKQQEIDAAKVDLQKRETGPGSGGAAGEAEVLKSRAKLVTLTSELNVLEDKLATSSVENAAKREDAERKLNDTIEKDSISTQQKIAEDSIASQKAVAESRYAMGLMTKDQLLQIEQQLEDQKYQIARDAIQRRLALEDTATYKNPTAIAQLNNQLLQLDAQYNSSVIQNQAKLQEALAAPYTTMIDGVKNQFETGIADMLNGTKSFSQGLSAILTGVVQAFDRMVAQMLVRWIQSELTKTVATTSAVGTRTAVETGSVAATTAAHAVGAAAQVSTTVAAEGAKTGAVVAGNAVRTASDWAAALESTAATAWAAIKNIATKAWEAAASVYSAIAAIPYVGPFLAPAMALAAVGTVIAFAGNIASAEGGYDIPSGVNPVTQLHEQEMVLPKAQADVIRRMSNMAMGEGMKAQGDTHVHIHAVDAASFEKRLAQAGGTLQSMIRQAHRDGKGGQLRNTWGATG